MCVTSWTPWTCCKTQSWNWSLTWLGKDRTKHWGAPFLNSKNMTPLQDPKSAPLCSKCRAPKTLDHGKVTVPGGVKRHVCHLLNPLNLLQGWVLQQIKLQFHLLNLLQESCNRFTSKRKTQTEPQMAGTSDILSFLCGFLAERKTYCKTQSCNRFRRWN